MDVAAVERLARGTRNPGGFLVIDLVPVPGSNRRTEALGVLGGDDADRIGTGPMAFHFTDRREAHDAFVDIVRRLRADADIVSGGVTYVTDERTKTERIPQEVGLSAPAPSAVPEPPPRP